MLDAALEVPPREWPDLLDRMCGEDPDLRREVESLLRRHREIDGFLEGTAVEAMSPSPAPSAAGPDPSAAPGPDADGSEGRRIGAYRVVRLIARGGMGEVYLAERADGHFERRVALKLLPAGLDADGVDRRFRAERQILAGLEHPSIARLLDGGVTDAGRPYLVMEYVEGEPIDRHCDGRKLAVRERLELFLQVTEAVEHAHRALVVHRDLKPSNILVTADGRAKLLDFGIAKLLGERRGTTAPVTRTGRRWMTPEYAAPEQIEGEPVTAATDVYQLGVLLYLLVSGRLPFAEEDGSLHRLERAILETDPEKPSMAATRPASAETGAGPADPAENARARSTRPGRLRGTLRGDLDAIVLKALRKEPADRYPSVSAMAEDVDRHLRGLPVAARRGTVAYRSRTFLRRHRWGVSAAAVFVLLLIGYAATVTVQSERVRAALAEARVEAEKAEQVSAFLMDLFEASDPDQARGEEVTARELLDRGVESARELADQPEVQARMLEVVGLTRQRMGAYERSLPLLERSLALRREVFGREHEQVAASLNHLGALHRLRGDLAAAEPHLREALAMRRDLLGDEHEDVAVTADELARVHEALGDYDRAEPLYREALATRRALLGDRHRQTATSLNDLGLLLLRKGDAGGAEALLREAVTIYRDALGEDHPWVATALGNLGLVLLERDDAAGAEALFRRALAMHRRLMGAEHPYVPDDLHRLASAAREQGRVGEADSLAREALRMGRAVRGDDHPRLARYLVGRARIELARDAPAEAEAHLREALRIRRETLPARHWRIAEAEGLLGEALSMLDSAEEGGPLLRRSHARLLQAFGADDRRTREAARRLAASRGLPPQPPAHSAAPTGRPPE